MCFKEIPSLNLGEKGKFKPQIGLKIIKRIKLLFE